MHHMKDFRFLGKKVLVRLDFDTPVDKKTGNIKDDFRIRINLPTIRYLLEKKPKQIILMWKLGRPKNKENYLKTDKGAEYLGNILKKKVYKVDEGSPIPDKKIVAMENVRFNKDEKSPNMIKRAEEISRLGDLFVNDAFAMAHRKEATTTGIMEFLPSCIGLNFERELNIISKTIKSSEKPLVSIIGGAKPDKINVIKNLLKKSDKIIVSGVLANTFLKAKGIDIGSSIYCHESIEDAKKILEKYPGKIVLPIDSVLGKNLDKNTKPSYIVLGKKSCKGMIMDIGQKTIEKYLAILSKAKTVIWGGPLGVFELENFRKGTYEITKFLSERNITKLIGGGDTGEAVRMFGLSDKMTYVSSGGGAFLELMAGRELPAVSALEKNSKRFKI